MGFAERHVPVDRYFRVDIDLTAELARVEKIEMLDAFFVREKLCNFGFFFRTAGGVQHFVHCFADDVDRNFEDKDADDKAGDRIKYRKTEHCTADADEGTNGGECIGAVMPGIRHESV